MSLPHPHLLTVLDFSSIAVAAVGGALHALRHKRYRFDVIGVMGLALVSALGGGIARDLLLQQGPPLAITDIRYLYMALLAGAASLLFGRFAGARATRVMLFADAGAISLFAVAGTSRALDFHVHWLPAIMLGVTTSVGGGSLRDIMSGATPHVFEPGNFYALAALAASVVYLLLTHTALPAEVSILLAIAVGFMLRLLSVHLNWRTAAAAAGGSKKN